MQRWIRNAATKLWGWWARLKNWATMVDFTLWSLMWHPYRTPDDTVTTVRADLMKRYFQAAPPEEDKRMARALGWAGNLALLGALALLVRGEDVFALPLAVLGALALGNGVSAVQSYAEAWRLANRKPTDTEISQFLRDDIAAVLAKAVEVTGIPSVPSPPVAYGPVYDGEGGLPCIVGDRPNRYRAHRMIVLCAEETHLYLYQCQVDFITGKIGKAELREIYCQDVTMIAVADHSPDALFLVRLADGTANHTSERKVELTDLRVCVPGRDESEIIATLARQPVEAFVATTQIAVTPPAELTELTELTEFPQLSGATLEALAAAEAEPTELTEAARRLTEAAGTGPAGDEPSPTEPASAGSAAAGSAAAGSAPVEPSPDQDTTPQTITTVAFIESLRELVRANKAAV